MVEEELSKPLTAIDRRLYVRKCMQDGVENRLEPLKELENDIQKIKDEFCHELFQLEKRFHEEAEQYYKKRDMIVNGLVDPADDSGIEANWKARPEEVDVASFTSFYTEALNLPEYCMGVPNFWLHIFTTSKTISQIIYEPDIEALTSLTNVTIDYGEKSFTLEFHFKENAFFRNNILTKKYILDNKLDRQNVLSDFEGYKICNCSGCKIYWKRRRNLTAKIITKNGKPKFKQVDSFFNFFNPPVVDTEHLSSVDNEKLEVLNVHFEIGNFFREEIIPKAFLYFIGAIVDDWDENGDDLSDSDEESVGLVVREDEKHIANVARVLQKINWH